MKMTLTHKPVVLSAIALITLAACGGGGGGTDGGGSGGGGGATFSDDIAFGDITSTDSANLIVLSLDASEIAVTSETGILNRQGNTFSYGSVVGTISDDRTSVELANGLITLDGEAGAFAARFDAEQGDINTLGIVGVASRTADLPSGSVAYVGDTVITVEAGTDLFELTGTATITADFGAATQNVTTALTGLSGTRQPATGPREEVPNAGTLTIAGSTVNGATFSGGTATIDSTVLSLSGAQTTALEGAFYGPAGVEVGGVFIIKDGSTRIFGDFLGN